MTFDEFMDIISKTRPRDWVGTNGLRVYKEDIDLTIRKSLTDRTFDMSPIYHCEVCYRGVALLSADVALINDYRTLPVSTEETNRAVTTSAYNIAYILSPTKDRAEFREFVESYGIEVV